MIGCRTESLKMYDKGSNCDFVLIGYRLKIAAYILLLFLVNIQYNIQFDAFLITIKFTIKLNYNRNCN